MSFPPEKHEFNLGGRLYTLSLQFIINNVEMILDDDLMNTIVEYCEDRVNEIKNKDNPKVLSLLLIRLYLKRHLRLGKQMPIRLSTIFNSYSEFSEDRLIYTLRGGVKEKGKFPSPRGPFTDKEELDIKAAKTSFFGTQEGTGASAGDEITVHSSEQKEHRRRKFARLEEDSEEEVREKKAMYEYNSHHQSLRRNSREEFVLGNSVVPMIDGRTPRMDRRTTISVFPEELFTQESPGPV
jgi:hypothetical protein